jgi:hypothetical protein
VKSRKSFGGGTAMALEGDGDFPEIRLLEQEILF